VSEFCDLHIHSSYSVLDALGRPKDIIKRSIELGQKAVSISDHGSLGACVEQTIECENYGIKPIIAIEAYVKYINSDFGIEYPKSHLVLIAKTEAGWHNLLKLLGASKTRVGRDNISRTIFPMDSVLQNSEGLIATASCISGSLQRLITSGHMDVYKTLLDRFVEAFKEDFYLEVHAHDIPEEKVVAEVFLNEMGIKTICATDAHYLNASDWKAHGFLQAVRFSSSNKIGIKPFSGTHSYYLHSYDEIIERYNSVGIDAIPLCQNTMEIVDKVEFKLALGKSYMPEFRIRDKTLSYAYKTKILRDKCYDGARQLYSQNLSKEITDRLDHELFIIDKMGYVDYFLLVSDIVDTARTLNVGVGAGRGSGAGSIAAYSLGITSVDPIKYGLMFSRFLNYGRSTVCYDDFGIGEE